MKKIIVIALTIATLLVIGSQTVLADQSYHTERIDLSVTDEGAAAGHSLRNGQVVNIHPNGPVNGAIELYVLNDALPETEYEVWWDIGIELPTNLGGDPSPLVITTDKNGNGKCVYQIPRQWQIDMGFTDVDFTVRWIFKSGGIIVFATEWVDVHVD